MEHVSTPCWIWSGAINRWGYGIFNVKGRNCLAHRIAWELTREQRPELLVLHKCDNPACVRPDHLFLGTDRDNSNDKVLKNRQNASRHWFNGELLSLTEIAETCSIEIGMCTLHNRLRLGWSLQEATTRPVGQRRFARWIEFSGRCQCLTDWAKELRVPRSTLADKIDTQGVEVIGALLEALEERKAS